MGFFKENIVFTPLTAVYLDEYDGLQFLFVTCVLYKLGVLYNPVMPNMGGIRYSCSKIMHMAELFLTGHPPVFQDPRREEYYENY